MFFVDDPLPTVALHDIVQLLGISHGVILYAYCNINLGKQQQSKQFFLLRMRLVYLWKREKKQILKLSTTLWLAYQTDPLYN